MQEKPQNVQLNIKKEAINPYNENYEATLHNIYISSILMHQIFGRLGYQIKIQEQILMELKKLNEGSK
jgi:hypothetical protein